MNRKDIVVILLFVVLLAGSWKLVTQLDHSEQNTETEMVFDAVRNAALTCYAVEGAYPMQLSYLEDRYGLSYDHSHYMVIYSTFASNIFPDIRVIEQKAVAQ